MIEGSFRHARGRFVLDAAFRFPAAGVTGLFGPSGCGKSTLLRCLAGLVPRAEGRLVVGGTTWHDTVGRVFVPPHERGVGYVFQHAALFPHLTVAQNVAYAIARRPAAPAGGGGPVNGSAPTFEEAVARTGVEHLLDRAPATLSGGERQRVALARALAMAPRLLLMDEPVSSLDRDGRSVLLPYLRELCQSLAVPVLYVSHDAAEVASMADTVLVMGAGRIAASLPREEFLRGRA